MWEEWRRPTASENYSAFVHNQWGSENFIDISRNLSKFGKMRQSEAVSAARPSVAKKIPVKPSADQNNVTGTLIDEKEVLSVLFQVPISRPIYTEQDFLSYDIVWECRTTVNNHLPIT
jgi:hypothetical protein